MSQQQYRTDQAHTGAWSGVCRRLNLALLFLLAAQAAAQQMAAPTALHVNLGPLPIDVYAASNSPQRIPGCTAPTVRDCYKVVLAAYGQQGVTAVRFQFAFRGAGSSTAMDAGGNLNAGWLANVALFFEDVADAGIPGVVPSPNFYSWQNDGEYYRRVCNPSNVPIPPSITSFPSTVRLLTDTEITNNLGETLANPSCGTNPVVTLRFWPTSPFGAWPTVIGPNSGPPPPVGTVSPQNLLIGGAVLFESFGDSCRITPCKQNAGEQTA